MKKKKWFTITLTVIFIAVSGIVYSCRGGEGQTQVILESEDDYEETGTVPNGDMKYGKENSLAYDSDKASVEKQLKKAAQPEQTDTKKESGVQAESSDASYVYVHVCGSVKKPDVYRVNKNDRIIDAINAAGGLTKDAAGDTVNQAAQVTDGEQIYIPSKKEAKRSGISANQKTTKEGQVLENETLTGKVNINAASKEELMTLKGIGEAKAEDIIAYREEHGNFKSIEEIKNISGIKDSVFNKISNGIIAE